jgi:hypothetical protein
MSEWQPIDTAPKDGTQVLLYDPNLADIDENDLDDRRIPTPQLVGWWRNKGWELVHYSAFRYNPTHWMPLPDGPAERTT